jgi:hypothetical protein
MRDELHPLRLAAAERRALLAELEIIQPRVVQRFQRALDLLHAGEKLDAFLHGQIQHLRDVLAAVFDVERLAIEPFPSHVSHRTNAGGRKFISSLICPAPSHSGQRPARC